MKGRKLIAKNKPELSGEVESGSEFVGLFPNIVDPTALSNRKHLAPPEIT